MITFRDTPLILLRVAKEICLSQQNLITEKYLPTLQKQIYFSYLPTIKHPELVINVNTLEKCFSVLSF